MDTFCPIFFQFDLYESRLIRECYWYLKWRYNITKECAFYKLNYSKLIYGSPVLVLSKYSLPPQNMVLVLEVVKSESNCQKRILNIILPSRSESTTQTVYDVKIGILTPYKVNSLETT